MIGLNTPPHRQAQARIKVRMDRRSVGRTRSAIRVGRSRIVAESSVTVLLLNQMKLSNCRSITNSRPSAVCRLGLARLKSWLDAPILRREFCSKTDAATVNRQALSPTNLYNTRCGATTIEVRYASSITIFSGIAGRSRPCASKVPRDGVSDHTRRRPYDLPPPSLPT